MNLKSKIPSFYHRFFPELLEVEFPSEKIATCDTCTLCRSSRSPYISTKCCIYFPHLSNFLLGGILVDKENSLVEGKDRVRKQIITQLGVTPYGIIPSLAYSINQKEAESQGFWSRPHELAESQRCPYYDNGKCTVWKYRENLCVTHFCSSIGGEAGKSFWKKVNQYMKMAETSLAQYAMQQLGWPSAKIKTKAVSTADFDLDDEHGNINKENYSRLWGEWAGREEEFYIKCYEIVSKLDAATFKKITGLKRELLDAAIRDTQTDFVKNILPEKLIFNPEVDSEEAEEGFTLLSLGENTAKIPSSILPLIRGFNGKRTTVEVFQLGYNVLYNLEKVVDDLRKNDMLNKV